MKRRHTRQKESILELLRNTDSHPTADRVYDEVRKTLPSISKGTVYRNLRILCQEGEISELNTAGNVCRYEGNMMNHYHFRCDNCGDIYDLDEPVDTGIDEKIAGLTGFQVTHHHLEFRGMCNKCQETRKKKKGGQ